MSLCAIIGGPVIKICIGIIFFFHEKIVNRT